jgi:hypothetical protein
MLSGEPALIVMGTAHIAVGLVRVYFLYFP